MRFGVVQFPGSNCDQDCLHAAGAVMGQDAFYLWHKETNLCGADCVIVPGGFSYGDYLRGGAIARFAPIMASVKRFAADGGLVLGICNGFQILLEAGLLPGAMLRNASLRFQCQMTRLRVERGGEGPFASTARTGEILRIPIAHGEGNYHADAATLAELDRHGQVLFRYCDERGHTTPEANPNGSIGNIAGITNRAGNVLGMMPHPERAAEAVLGSQDGRVIFDSILRWIRSRHISSAA
ncbi:MAG: phosphoribosylformylglycinamidine synthase subunit PurQ [Verrucomicrobiae bacterium]|nr:phosphoribosylformylglycinamidine synthase subunit PurQ [Verrucomicrobiae bacterium]